ncbi:hypothetical protein GGS21DRAFT_496970 [Xylaria nigripes]|nr:hypothetical protein GGS21DRAFT_496970 [Xylaria nigripes]
MTMTATETVVASGTGRVISDQQLTKELDQFLSDIDSDLERNAVEKYSADFAATYKTIMSNGVKGLNGTLTIENNQVWDDAIVYGREVIADPQDTSVRAASPWARSCSDILKELEKRYGPETIEAGRLGSEAIISKHYNGDRLAISHVDKKASFLRHYQECQIGAGFYPQSSLLGSCCYQTASLTCGLAMTAFLPTKQAVLAGYISHLSVCDDLGIITRKENDVRKRMIIMSTGAGYHFGGRVINAYVDGTAKQAAGTGDGKLNPIDAVMAWRAINGCSTIYSEYNFRESSLEQGLVEPIVMMTAHDLLDWRCDVAANNHENAVSAAYGFGIESPFHAMLEGMLKVALTHPRSGVYGMASIMYMHFTGPRYGAWNYHGEEGRVCEKCVSMLSEATDAAGLKWEPKSPPESWAAGLEFREMGARWSNYLEDQPIIQESLSWFQFLLTTGKIWNFDVLAKGVKTVDGKMEWS